MKITEIIQQPEGRRLEFKEKLPASNAIVKTLIAFSNDAGGDLYIGIKDSPREIVGVDEEELFRLEEKISNIIYENSYPIILPDISFHNIEDKHIIKVHVYKGNNLPYYIKTQGRTKGTYIRVGSSNRLADKSIIKELERQKRNISFDSESVYDIDFEGLHFDAFSKLFKEKTTETLNKQDYLKLGLVKDFQGKQVPSIAGLLFSDSPIVKAEFHYAKIECARFKGYTSDEFIDQKTIDTNIANQAELAYEFVLRHINKSAKVRGVYTESHWEYPIKAIREVIRNAVVHRDYSLTGKDIKVAIYDDMVEVTSPGTLLPSIDFNEMESRQSDVRNKVIAPVFKKLGLIDQWGNGLKLIIEELEDYPEIEFKWREVGLQFQVSFEKKHVKDYSIPNSVAESESEYRFNGKISTIRDQVGTRLGLSRAQAGTKSFDTWDQVVKVLGFCVNPQPIRPIMDLMNRKNRTKFRDKYINTFLEYGLMQMTIPDKPTSSKQKYQTTKKGIELMNFIS